jgi:hypothetical protein
MNTKYAMIIALLVLGLITHSASADTTIPSWIKSNAKYWKDGQIGDDEYVKGVQYLIQNEIIQIPQSDKSVEKSSKIPSWVKNNAGYWADGSLGDAEYVLAMQYLVSMGLIDVSQHSTHMVSNASSTPVTSSTSSTDSDTSKCDSMTSAADKETCLDDIKLAKELQAKIASATPYVVGPVTYYLIGTDLIDAGDGAFITVHTVIENTVSDSKNVDLYCFGPIACNYHLSDGQGVYPPAMFPLTSGHLEIITHKPVLIDWNFYSKNRLAPFVYDSSRSYSFKIDESFGHGTIPLEIKNQ